MPSVKRFVIIPSDAELRDRKNWTRKRGHEYVAVRHMLLVIEQSESKPKNGPAFSSVPMPVDINVRDLRKRTTTITATSSVTQTIDSTISLKLTQEISSAIKSGLKAGSELGAELGTEVQSRVGSEIVEALRTSLSGTKTYSVSESKEDSRELTYKVTKRGSGTRKVNKFVLLRRHVRDVFLVRSDVMTVRWKSTFGFKSGDDPIGYTDKKVIPLFRVVWHEPQEDDYGLEFGDYEPDVPDDELIVVTELPDTGFAPEFGRRPPLTAMSDLAHVAFPTTFGGKKVAEEVVPSPPPRKLPARRPSIKASHAQRGSHGASKRSGGKSKGSTRRKG